MARGRPPTLSDAEKHELRRWREAGVPISRIALAYGLGKRRVLQILAEQRERFGPEQLPRDKRHLVRAR
jgi:hypothetical protein